MEKGTGMGVPFVQRFESLYGALGLKNAGTPHISNAFMARLGQPK